MAVRSSLLLGAIAVIGLGAVHATAQTRATPAEFPPQSYTGSQYVDSTGCAYVRVGNGPVTNWVPRVTRNRVQLCGFVPTDVGPVGNETAPTGPIITLEDPVEAPVVETAPRTERMQTVADVCAGKTGVLSGFVTANGDPVDCGPGEAPVAVTVPIPAPVVTPAPVAPRPVPTPAPVPVVAPVEVPVVTPAPVVSPNREEICAGKFGIQLGFVTADGGPVDCGPAPEIAATVPEPSLRRVSRAEICAEIAATGKRVIDASTNAPVVCPAPAPVPAVNGAPSAPGAPTVAAAPAAPALQAPAGTSVGGSAPAIRSLATRPSSSFSNPFAVFTKAPVPASNPDPASVVGEVIAPPPGYQRVWTDGRINPQRGIRKVTREEAIAMGLAVR